MNRKEMKLCQQLRSIVKNAATTKLCGGCFKHEVRMNLPLNFIAVPNAVTLGAIMHESSS